MPIELDMLVRIKDKDECGIWRGIVGKVSYINGPLINVKTWAGTAQQMTAAMLKPTGQGTLFNGHSSI